MATILLRTANSISSPGSTVKGTPLTNSEVDNNFSNINITLGVLSNLSTTANANLVSAINSITYSVGSSGNVLTSNGNVWASTSLPASGLSYVAKSANYTINNNEGVLANTALGAFTITLPVSPIVGNQVVVADAGGDFGANALTIARNGSTIANLADDLICDINDISVQLVYSGNTWEVYSQIGGNGGTGVTLTGTQTLTNKTLTSPILTTPALGTPSAIVLTNATGTVTNLTLVTPALGTPSAIVLTNATGTPTAAIGLANATGLPLSTGVTGTLAITNGGTGASTLAGANIAVTSASSTFTGTQTFSGNSSTIAMILNDVAEVANVSAIAATGNVNIDVTTQSVIYFTTSASGNWTVNLRASSGTALNSIMTTGQSVTVAFLVTQGATAYYNSVFQVDGTGITPKWQGGTAPSAGNASSVDVYSYTVIKTANATFTAFASQTKFA